MDKEKASVMIITAPCWNCEKPMLVAMIGQHDGPSAFTKAEIQLAEKNGVFIKEIYSHTADERYLANACWECGAFVGNWYLFTNYWAEAMYGRLEYVEVSA
jgi:hypothetical protein